MATKQLVSGTPRHPQLLALTCLAGGGRCIIHTTLAFQVAHNKHVCADGHCDGSPLAEQTWTFGLYVPVPALITLQHISASTHQGFPLGQS